MLVKVVYTQILAFLENNANFSDSEFGLRPGKSTRLPLGHFIERFIKVMDSGN